MLDNALNQPSKFKTKNWVEINEDLHRVYATASQVKFKTSLLRSSLCDYDDAYILVTVSNTGTAGEDPHNRNKKVIYKNCTSFTDCISEINNTEIDHAKDIDVAMPMYNLTEYTYGKTSGSLWQYYRDEPATK